MELKNINEKDFGKKLKSIEIEGLNEEKFEEVEGVVGEDIEKTSASRAVEDKLRHKNGIVEAETPSVAIKTPITLNMVSGIILGVFSLIMVLALSIGFRYLVSPWQMVNIPNQFMHSIVSGSVLLIVASLFVPAIMLAYLLLDMIPDKDKMSKKYNKVIQVTPFYKTLITIVLVLGYVAMFIAFYYLFFTQGLSKGGFAVLFCVIGGLLSSISTLYLSYAIIQKETKPIVVSSIIITLAHLVFYVIYFWWWVPLLVVAGLIFLGIFTGAGKK